MFQRGQRDERVVDRAPCDAEPSERAWSPLGAVGAQRQELFEAFVEQACGIEWREAEVAWETGQHRVRLGNCVPAARLHAACTKVSGRDRLFTQVVHVQPEAVFVAYGPEAEARTVGKRRKAGELRGHIEAGRLLSLEQ